MLRNSGRFDVTVDDVLSSIEPSSFNELLALELIEPSNQWDHTGTIAAAAHNVACAWGAEPWGPDKFVPKFEPDRSPVPANDLEQQEAILKQRYGNRK